MLLNFVPHESYIRSGRAEGQIYFYSYVTNILLGHPCSMFVCVCGGGDAEYPGIRTIERKLRVTGNTVVTQCLGKTP